LAETVIQPRQRCVMRKLRQGVVNQRREEPKVALFPFDDSE
jgi:hypothetical protein